MPTEMPQENGGGVIASTNGTMETSNGKMEMPIDDIDMSDETDGLIELKDEFCDPENPIQVHFQDVSAAAYKIRGGVQRTPCTVSIWYRIFVSAE